MKWFFYGENMNPKNPSPSVKLSLMDEPIPTDWMNYMCALCPKAMMWIHLLMQTDPTFKVLWSFSFNLIDMYCRFCLSWKFACVWMIGMCPGLVLHLGHRLPEVHKMPWCLAVG
jgi:hypothetical protein